MPRRPGWLWILLLLGTVAVLYGCAVGRAQGGQEPAAVAEPQAAPTAPGPPALEALPPLSGLGAGLTLRGTSAVSVTLDGWPGADQCTVNTTQLGAAIQLNSGAHEYSAAWYGVRIWYNGRTVPYLAPYSALLHTDAACPFWVALADYRQGRWVTPATQYAGAAVSIPITLDANAADRAGYCWLAVITYGGTPLRVDSLDFSYPDTPADASTPVDYQQWVTMRDGVRLATDIYLPYAESDPLLPDPPYPALLLRLPYNKGFVSWLGPALAPQNVAVMVQYFRGRLAPDPGWPNSEGEPSLFRDHAGPDHFDGVDTVSWLEQRTWYNGVLALHGNSAQGLAAYDEATALGNRLAGFNCWEATANFGDFGALRNGCFKESILNYWIPSNGYPDALLQEAKQGFSNGGYWEGVDFDAQAAGVACPGFHTSGWWDMDVEGSIKSWKLINTLGQGAARGNQWLMLGPWSHETMLQRNVGQLSFPATGDLHDPSVVPDAWGGSRIGLNFVMSVLGRNPALVLPPKRVHAYFIGEAGNTTEPHNTWYDLDDWPPPYTAQTLYLASTRMLVGAVPAAGTLSWDCDPHSPIASVGGANFPSPPPFAIQAGPYDQSVIPDSGAVLKFSMAPLVSDWSFAGPFNCVLYVSTDKADTDIMAKLVDVYPDGRELLVSDSAVRLSWYLRQHGLGPVVPDATYAVDLEIGQRAYVCAAGHKLELWLQSSNYPRFAINPGNGDAFLDATGSNGVAQLNTLFLGNDSESRLILPVFDPRT